MEVLATFASTSSGRGGWMEAACGRPQLQVKPQILLEYRLKYQQPRLGALSNPIG